MPLKSIEARSITAQLVLRFAPAAALLLFCGLGLLYGIVVRHAWEEDATVLADKMFAVRADLAGPNGLAGLRQELSGARASGRNPYLIRVLNPSGTTVAETPGMSALLPLAVFPVASATASAPVARRTGDRIFSLATAIEKPGGEPFTIQLAQDRSEDARFAKKFGALLGSVMILGVFASAGIAITVARRGLRPLREMAASLQRISPARLDQRVPATGWPPELRPLALAFDELLDRLQDSFTRLSQFSADLAHELRTPIANIRGESEVALTRPRTPEEYREVLESNVGECQRLSGIIDNLLFVARAEAAEGQLQPARLAARPAIEKIAAYYRTIAEDRQIAIVCGGEAELSVDPLLFDRAVGNLLDNALRFTADGGSVTLGIVPKNSVVEISVIDSGCGIAAEHLPRIFDRFYRADPSRSSAGTGLGLALVKSIAELHGGAVRVTSEIGTGTTVTLSFPRGRDPA